MGKLTFGGEEDKNLVGGRSTGGFSQVGGMTKLLASKRGSSPPPPSTPFPVGKPIYIYIYIYTIVPVCVLISLSKPQLSNFFRPLRY